MVVVSLGYLRRFLLWEVRVVVWTNVGGDGSSSAGSLISASWTMDYFGLPLVSQTASIQAASSSSGHLPTESPGTQHAVIALEDGQDDSRTPVCPPYNILLLSIR